MIVKVQVPLAGVMNRVLVYNQDRSTQFFLPCDEKLLELMAGEPKKFLEIDIIGEDGVELIGEAPWQDW